MEITEVNIYPFDTSGTGGRVRAVADIVIDEVLLIKGIKIVENKHGGLFIVFPQKKTSTGNIIDIVQPLTKELNDKIRRAVIDKYKEAFGMVLKEDLLGKD